MKKLIIILLSTLLVISSVSAESLKNTNYTESEYKTAVIDESLHFTATREGSIVELNWESYNHSDFKYYKIMRSETHSNPIYPDQPAIRVLDNSEIDSIEFSNWSTETAVYRVCVITSDKSRICSNTVKLEGYTKTEKVTTYEKKETETKEYVTTEKLTSKLQIRADAIIDKMIERLEKRYEDDNESKVKNLSNLITKLDKVNDTVSSTQTKALITYLLEEIEAKKETYSTGDDIETIFDILEED